MIEFFKSVGHNLVAWRKQVLELALITLRQETKGTFLGVFWLIIKRAIFVGCLWVAIYLGIRGGSSEMSQTQYLMWLTAGLIPWFYLSEAIGTGSKLFLKYKHLVCRLKFPIELIPVFYLLSAMFVHLMLLAILIVMYLLFGGTFDVYFLQLPLVVVLMYVFSIGWSLLTSTLTAFSRDIEHFIKAIKTPIFWLSGIIFDISSVDIPVFQAFLLVNPITFIAECYRTVFSNGSVIGDGGSWIWSDPVFFLVGIAVIALTLILGLLLFAKFRKDIPDVV